MRLIRTLVFFSLVAFVFSCQENVGKKEIWIQEIYGVEQAFNDLAQKEGLAVAFSRFSAEDGVIKRKKEVIKGPDKIREYYAQDANPNESLTWKPTFVDVSNSGDLAYTYGNYIFTYPDSIGKIKESRGIFHTVWKRQEDGNWKFVWD